MREVLDSLQGFIEKLENFQSDPEIVKPESKDAVFVKDLLDHLHTSVTEKTRDAQITHEQLHAISVRCVPFSDAALNTLVTEKIRLFCSQLLRRRNQLCRPTMAFIMDYQLISNPCLLNFSAYDPGVIDVLKQILSTDNVPQAISQTSAEIIYQAVHASHFFAEHDLLLASKWIANRIEHPFKAVLTSADLLSPKRHNATDFTLDLMVYERFKRSALYGNLQLSRSAPVLRSVPKASSSSTSRSLPTSPKDASPSTEGSPTFLTQYSPQSAVPSGVPPVIPQLVLTDLPDITRLHLEEKRRKKKPAKK